MNNTEIKKILIIRLRFIGDVILTTPLIKALKENIPGVSIDYLAEEKPLETLKNNPYLNNLIVYNKKESIRTIMKIRKNRYDAVIDVFGNPRSSLLTLLSGAKIRIGWEIRLRKIAYNKYIEPAQQNDSALKSYGNVLKIFNIGYKDDKPEIYLTKEEEEYTNIFIKENNIDKNKCVVGIQPGASWPAKMWGNEKYAELGDMLIKDGKYVVLFGGPKDTPVTMDVYNRMKAKPILAVGNSIRKDFGIFKACGLIITNNHGPLHIAVGLNRKTIIIFGPCEPEVWLPYKDKKQFRYLRKKVDCSPWPCGKDFCDDMKCMKAISTEEVFGVAKELCG